MKKALIRTSVARKALSISHTISFQEKTPRGMIDKSFDCPKEHLEFHLTQLKKMCFNVSVQTKKG